jgi:hypothetical protein
MFNRFFICTLGAGTYEGIECAVTSVKGWCHENALPYYKLKDEAEFNVPETNRVSETRVDGFDGKIKLPELYLA